jgi:hypothetical protein
MPQVFLQMPQPFAFRSPELLATLRKVECLRDRAAAQKDTLCLRYPSWDAVHDARLTTFAKVINVANSAQLALTFVGQHLLDPNWWHGTAKEKIPPNDANIYINEFVNFAKIAFVQFLFSSIESGFRILLRAVDPSACSQGTAEFKSVYECLLRSKLATTPPGGIDLLDLLRFIRNTVHNNGVFFNRSGTDEQVAYKGKTYSFFYGKAVDFVTWDSLISVAQDLIDLVVAVVSDGSVAGIAGRIQDPFAQR